MIYVSYQQNNTFLAGIADTDLGQLLAEGNALTKSSDGGESERILVL